MRAGTDINSRYQINILEIVSRSLAKEFGAINKKLFVCTNEKSSRINVQIISICKGILTRYF